MELFQNYGNIPSLQNKVFNMFFPSLNKRVQDEKNNILYSVDE
jgi:hypothetical protein